MDPVACYLGSNMELYLTDPYVSPLFGDFTGLPPLLIQVGESEVLRDEITLLAHKATHSGVQVMHEMYEDAVSGKNKDSSHHLTVFSLRFMYFKRSLSSKHHSTRSPRAASLVSL